MPQSDESALRDLISRWRWRVGRTIGETSVTFAVCADELEDLLRSAPSEPGFMTRTTVEPLNGTGLTGNAGHLTIRLVHQPTGIEVVARDRAEGIVKLRKALDSRARRELDLQEAERRAERKAAEAS